MIKDKDKEQKEKENKQLNKKPPMIVSKNDVDPVAKKNIPKEKEKENKKKKQVTTKKTTTKKNDDEKKKIVTGRRSKYYTHVEPNLERIRKMRQMGEYEENIAKKLGVGVSTWYEYRNRHPELQEALKTSKELLINDISDSLFRMGLGGIVVKKTKRYTKIRAGVKETHIEELTEEIPPNVAAAIYSLNNLDPERWKNRYREEVDIKLDEKQVDIHRQTIKALKERKVAGFDYSENEES